MARFSLPVPDDQSEIRTLMEAGWQLEARFGEEARMVPPPELARLMGFRDFVRDTERHAVEVAMRDSLDAAWREAEAALPEGWLLSVERLDFGDEVTYSACADAERPPSQYVDWAFEGNGDTAGAALRDLAAKLRERA